MNNKQKKIKKGFTLLELLIVIIILAILAAIAIPSYLTNIEKARETEARATLDRIRGVELAYYAGKGFYTTLPISLDMDNDGTDEISLALPQSPNFTYGAVPAGRFGRALRITGMMSYCMCFADGRFERGFACSSCP